MSEIISSTYELIERIGSGGGGAFSWHDGADGAQRD